jgi:hypothetical protein
LITYGNCSFESSKFLTFFFRTIKLFINEQFIYRLTIKCEDSFITKVIPNYRYVSNIVSVLTYVSKYYFVRLLVMVRPF